MSFIQRREPAPKKHQDVLNSRFLMSVYEGDFQSACRFLGQGADINVRGRDGETALSWSIRHSHTALALLLLDANAHVNIQDKNGNTALMYAVVHDDVTTAKRLIAAEADITIENKDGQQPLNAAFTVGNPAMVALFEKPLKQLLQQIPRPRRPAASNDGHDPHGDTMLTWAARTGQERVVHALVEAGTNTGVRNRDGQTALDIAKARGHLAIVELLSAAR